MPDSGRSTAALARSREIEPPHAGAGPGPFDNASDECLRYFFLPDAKVGCQPAVFWLGAAAITLIFSFLGFLASRLPLCSPLAMSISLPGFDDCSIRYADFRTIASVKTPRQSR